jgi:hypothetical protein
LDGPWCDGINMKTRSPKRKCLLCGGALLASPYATLWLHPQSDTCTVAVTDGIGISVDDTYEVIDGQVYGRDGTPSEASAIAPGSFIVGNPGDGAFFGADAAIKLLFESAELPFLGGMSGARGWSSISTFQKCPYLWKSKYGGKKADDENSAPKAPALEIGTLVHHFLAVHYMQRIDPQYPIDPESARRFLELAPVTPEFIQEAWRLFDGYRAYYGDESWMTPLAVEHLAMDPRTGFSCRWDLVFRVDAPYESWLPGTYVLDFKTSSANTFVGQEEWRNDGQIFGEIDLYEQLGFHRRWGALRGAVVSRIIKTKVPQYHMVLVRPSKAVLKDHRKSLGVWTAQMDLAAATGNYVKSRAACVTRYMGLCEMFDHCAGGEIDAAREIES